MYLRNTSVLNIRQVPTVNLSKSSSGRSIGTDHGYGRTDSHNLEVPCLALVRLTPVHGAWQACTHTSHAATTFVEVRVTCFYFTVCIFEDEVVTRLPVFIQI